MASVPPGAEGSCRMKRDLIMGWVFIAMALIMIFCIVVNCVNDNWGNLPICGFAFGMNLSSAVNRFRDYKRRKEYENQYSIMSMRCWSAYDEDEDDPEDNRIITD
jgi:hypothetical protein